MEALPVRVELGLAAETAPKLLEFFTKRLEIWLIVAGTAEATDISEWLSKNTVPFKVEIFTLAQVNEVVSQIPGSPRR